MFYEVGKEFLHRYADFGLAFIKLGEEARVEGVEAGADDYMVKPFAARELLARVASRLELARVRKESMEALRKHEQQLQLLYKQEQAARDALIEKLCAMPPPPIGAGK